MSTPNQRKRRNEEASAGGSRKRAAGAGADDQAAGKKAGVPSTAERAVAYARAAATKLEHEDEDDVSRADNEGLHQQQDEADRRR
jgi:hypothetical protein